HTGNIRTGAKKYILEAIFDVSKNNPVRSWLAEKGFEEEDGEIILRKELNSEGRSRIQIGGSLSPLSLLKELGSMLSEIHRQNDQLALFQKEEQLNLLDAYADLEGLREDFSLSYRAYVSLKRHIEQFEKAGEERLKHIENLRFQLEELSSAKLEPEEENTLSIEENRLIHAEKLSENYSFLSYHLHDSDDNLIQLMSKIAATASKIESIDPEFAACYEEIQGIYSGLKEVYAQVQEKSEDIFYSQEQLDAIQKRLNEINRLKKKYRMDLTGLVQYQDKLEEDLEKLSTEDSTNGNLQKELQVQIKKLAELALELSVKRKKAITQLEKEMKEELLALGMRDASFTVRLQWEASEEGEVSEQGKMYRLKDTGLDSIEFFFTANKGEKLQSLKKVASGGEASRLMLAIKCIMEKKHSGRLLVFDEIDAGIGGETARVLASRVKKLAKHNQVILITHLQQVAAVTEEQVRIKKITQGERTISVLKKLDEKERPEELAKMISGEKFSNSALEHAKELLFRPAV
ncbi:MAG: DNA repair protein RecN, partial [Leptospiraceae bacterium]|nr:DNA repair protein RecN [Leptospiraceae bacterium]